MITHYDLFAGIGGFSIALEEVFSDEAIRHIFCEWESFPTAVLRRHWPDGEFWGDIAELVKYEKAEFESSGKPRNYFSSNTYSRSTRLEKTRAGEPTERGRRDSHDFTIVTGGFPCQPFSHAGRRKGTADDRYQWPNMFEVIRNVKPDWVIAENVRGLVTWNEGMVLETVCADLESEGYEVQPFIIPVVAVGAPHRRDRVWIIANCEHQRQTQRQYEERPRPEEALLEGYGNNGDVTHTRPQRRGEGAGEGIRSSRQESERPNRQYPDWSRNWQEVAFATCDDSVDDGLSRLVDGVSYSRAKWRKDSLKAYGNGIVSQVAMEIMKGIKASQ